MSATLPHSPPATPIAETSVSHHFETGWQLFRVRWRRFVIAVLAIFGSWVGLELSVIMLHRLGVIVNVVLHLAWVVLAAGLVVGFHRMALDAVRGEEPRLASLTGFLARGPAYVAAWLMYMLAVLSGLVLLIVPGLLVAVRHAYFGQILATRSVTGYEALRLAGLVSIHRWWAMFRVFATAFGFNLAGAACLGVGLLVTVPVTVLAATSLFHELDLSSTKEHQAFSSRTE